MARIVVIADLMKSLAHFRGDLLSALVKAGHEVVACASGEDKEVLARFREMGVDYRTITLDRNGITPLMDLHYLLVLTRLLLKFRPDIVLSYTIKPVIYGSLAARFAGVPQSFSMITGLGYVFTGKTLKQRFVRAVVHLLYRLSLPQNHAVFFLNRDDLSLLTGLGLIQDPTQAVLVNGEGVDLNFFSEGPPRTTPPVFLLIARLLKDKGIAEYVDAARILKSSYPEAKFRLVGPFDSNPSAISRSQVAEWQREGVIEYLGETRDVRPYIAEASVFVLPSYYREGTPRSILEAMAMGRPIITTDAPGCRETVVEGENGFLVPVMDIDALVKAMERFIVQPDLIQWMGRRSREIAVEKYDVHKVNHVIMRTMGLDSDRGVHKDLKLLRREDQLEKA
jgi:glycosyltransferase involved in cell wall biosynthesis